MAQQLEKVSIIPSEQPKTPALTPMDMLSRAVETGAGLDMVEKLMGLQERWETNQARKAFDEAIAAAKGEIPPIIRNAKGHNDKRYADFAAIASVVDPILARHGLSYRFRTVQSERICVTCVLAHKAGHFEETTLAGPADTSGSKNAIQAIGSTLTYLQRYSLVQMLGLAAAHDDDGRAGTAPASISEDQIGELTALMESVGANKVKFLQFFRIEQLAQLPSKRYQEAVNMLNAKSRG